MKKRKGFLIVTGVLFLLIVCAIFYLKDGWVQSNKKQDKNIKVGVTIYDQYDPFIATITSGLEQEAKEIEVENGNRITLNIVSADGSQIQQNDQVDGFIEQGYDVICVNVVDRTASSIIIDKAKKADIPIIFFNREPVEDDMNRWEKLYYVGVLASITGTLQGQMVVEAIEESSNHIDRNRDGKIQYVLLEGEPGHQDASLRTEYCIKTIQEAGYKLEKLANENADWKRDLAAMKVGQWNHIYGDDIEAIISNNDDMALGAIDTLVESNCENWPLIVGVNATESARKEIKSGRLYGTVDIQASQTAEKIMKVASYLAGGMNVFDTVKLENEKYIYSDQAIITMNSESSE